MQLLCFSAQILFAVVREERRSSGGTGIGFRVGQRAPETDGWVSFGGQPDHVDRLFRASAYAVLLTATVTGPFQCSHTILRFKAGWPAGSDTEATARAELLNDRGKPFERVSVFHDSLGEAANPKCRLADT